MQREKDENISLESAITNPRKDIVSLKTAIASLKIAYAAGFDISDVTEKNYSQHLFARISNKDVEKALNNVITSPPLSLAEASTLFVSQSENDKEQTKRITGIIGTVETVSSFSKLENIWSPGDDAGTTGVISRKCRNAKGFLLSTHNALQNLNHIVEVAEFLSRHDF